jgi:hypothetical protein
LSSDNVSSQMFDTDGNWEKRPICLIVPRLSLSQKLKSFLLLPWSYCTLYKTLRQVSMIGRSKV